MNLYRSHFWFFDFQLKTRVFAVGKQAENWVRRWFKCFYFGPIPNLNCELTQRGLRARWSPRATGCDPWSMWLTCSYPLVERMQKNGQTVCWWENSIGLRLSLHMLSSTPTIKPHHFLHYWKRNFFPRTMWPSFCSSSRCGPPPLDFFKHPPEDDFKNPLDQAQAVGGSHLSHLWTFHGSSPSTSQSAMLFVWLSSQPPSPALGCRAAHSSEGEQKNFLWVWVGGATVFVCLIFTE